MHDAGVVSLSQPSPDLCGDVDGVTQRQRPPSNPLLERLPLVVRHHQIQLAIGRLVDLVDGADVRMVECLGGLGLLQKALLGRGVPRQVGWQQLDGHMAI